MAAPTATMADNQAARGKQGSVAGSAFIMVMAVTMPRLLGMVRDMVIAAQFGRTGHTEPTRPRSRCQTFLCIWWPAELISTSIPTFAEYLHKKDEKGAWETFSVVGTVMGMVATAFIVLMEIFAPQRVQLLKSRLRAGQTR